MIDLLVLENNQKFLISRQGESIVLTPEVKQPNTIHELFSNWEDDGIHHKELDWGKIKGVNVNLNMSKKFKIKMYILFICLLEKIF